MPHKVLNIIHNARKRGDKLFAVLIDPEKCNGSRLASFIRLTEEAKPDFIFIGGSQIKESIDQTVRYIKSHSSIPTVLFIGDAIQFSPNADAMLFLSLISGRNPDLLIGQHVLSARAIRQSGIETIPTGYILVDGGTPTAVETVSGTQPLSDPQTILSTAIAGEMLGQQLIYLEAGSGAKTPVKHDIISAVRANTEIPLIVGGGIRSIAMLDDAISAGADIIVVGNHLENHPEDMIPFAKFIKSSGKSTTNSL